MAISGGVWVAAGGHWPEAPAEAVKVSVAAIKQLDHLISEILRTRDDASKAQTLANSPLEEKLNAIVGLTLKQPTHAELTAFHAMAHDQATLPSGRGPQPLSLAGALNKLKHRDSLGLKFRIDDGLHMLVFLTLGVANIPPSINEVAVASVCHAARELDGVI